MKLNLLVCIILFFGISLTSAQQGNNPFQLEASKDSITQLSNDNPFVLSNANQEEVNPFEISATVKPQGVQGREDLEQARRKRISPSVNFEFLFFSGLLIFLTILVTLFRSTLSTYYKAFWNENILKLFHRQRPTWKASTIFLYLFFFLNISIFLSLWFSYNANNTEPIGSLTLKITLFVIALLLLKHLILSVLGSIFPIEKEVALYNFTIIVFAINLGLFLLPLNLLIAFGPGLMKPGIFYFTGILIMAVLGFRGLRAIFQTSNLFQRNKFHFFLYLCAVEIAPVFVLLKVVSG